MLISVLLKTHSHDVELEYLDPSSQSNCLLSSSYTNHYDKFRCWRCKAASVCGLTVSRTRPVRKLLGTRTRFSVRGASFFFTVNGADPWEALKFRNILDTPSSESLTRYIPQRVNDLCSTSHYTEVADYETSLRTIWIGCIMQIKSEFKAKLICKLSLETCSPINRVRMSTRILSDNDVMTNWMQLISENV